MVADDVQPHMTATQEDLLKENGKRSIKQKTLHATQKWNASTTFADEEVGEDLEQAAKPTMKVLLLVSAQNGSIVPRATDELVLLLLLLRRDSATFSCDKGIPLLSLWGS